MITQKIRAKRNNKCRLIKQKEKLRIFYPVSRSPGGLAWKIWLLRAKKINNEGFLNRKEIEGPVFRSPGTARKI